MPATQTDAASFSALLKDARITARCEARAYEGNRPTAQIAAEISTAWATLDLSGATWRCETQVVGDTASGGRKIALHFEAGAKAHDNASVGLRLELADWSTKHYLLMPAAVYAGNRFEVSGTWRYEDLSHIGPNRTLGVTPRVPRLNVDQGPSRIQLLSSDMSSPVVAIHSPTLKKGLILMTEDRTALGLTGFDIVENEDRTAATLTIKVPGVREVLRHNGQPSRDRGVSWKPGQSVTLRLVVHVFDCPNVQALYDKLFDARNDLRPEPTRHEEIPFASVWDIQERKNNEQSWVEKYGYYSVGMREVRSQDWQTAWVGGTNTLYPLLASGEVITRRRAMRTFDFMTNGSQQPSGFFRGSFTEGQWDDNGKALLRYSGDSLFFLIKDFLLLEERGGKEAVVDPWRRMTQRVADAFCGLWDKYGQFGHHASALRDEIVIGGSCTASMAPGGLALAAGYFNEPRYLDIAKKAGVHYHDNFVARGITNGGPGDASGCPDSESCAGLLESFATLWEVTGEERWLKAARDVAHQAATWVVNYDFAFPPESTFGKMNMLTNGTVWANIQNKHSAPGICTLSGVPFLKLFRATGDVRYLELIRDIAHAIPQFMSRADRPIVDIRPGQRWPVMPPGWINERVNMSDWEMRDDPKEEIGVGEIFGGSTWSEPAMMLTWTELPGLYAQPDTGVLCALDHVEAKWTKDRTGIEVKNPTKFDASVKMLVETSAQAKGTKLGPLPLVDAPRLSVPAGGVAMWPVKK